MKIGIHLSSFTTEWSNDVTNFIGLAKQIGYEVVEFPLLNPETFDIEKANRLLIEHNIAATCGTGINLTTDVTSLDEQIRLNGVNFLKKCVDICHSLGSKTLNGVLHSPWGMTIDRSKLIERRKQSIKSLKEVSNYSKGKDVTLCLEILNRYESSFINTIEEGLDFLKQIDSEFVKLHVDTFHSNIEEKNIIAAIDSAKDKIGHIHFADNYRGAPGTGQIDFENICKKLLDIEYDGNIVVECFVIPNTEVGNDVNIWRKLADNEIEMAKDSLRNIRKLLKSVEGQYV